MNYDLDLSLINLTYFLTYSLLLFQALYTFGSAIDRQTDKYLSQFTNLYNIKKVIKYANEKAKLNCLILII